MDLPQSFQFSQRSLQDYVDCRRRFLLRYIQEIAWPAIPSEPPMQSEILILRGQLFHHFVHQHLIGVPGDRLKNLIQDETLSRWWDVYLEYASAFIQKFHDWDLLPEIVLSTPMHSYRLMAKLDLLLIENSGRLTIIDWKTSIKKPKRQWLQDRIQTHVYPYVVAKSREKSTPEVESHPQYVEMIYWFPEFPNRPERFVYSHRNYSEDELKLSGLIDEVLRLEEDDFYKTDFEAKCTYCVYRSLCDRGVVAGGIEGLQEEWEQEYEETALDFEQIGEIAY